MTRRSTLTATLIVALACGEDRPPLAPVAELSGRSDPVLLAAGNIASCGTDRDELTARLLDTLSGTVLTLGDNAYPNGTLGDYQNCYDPTWGRHKARTYATLGNRDYNTGAADGAFDYFGNHAGPRAKGYYSFDLGAWHILVLNSNGAYVPYGAGSEQDAWLQNDLAANTQKCLLAAWHHPRFFSSSDSGWTSAGPLKTLWNRLHAAGADLVLNAQQHLYERFTPMTPDGAVDSVGGIREINVGTGGESTALPTVSAAHSEVVSAVYGVLKLTLSPDRYSWQFVPIAGQAFSDTGSAACHHAPPPEAPPSVDAGPDLRTEPAAPAQLAFRIADQESEAPWSYEVDWGDGTTDQGSAASVVGPLTAKHAYGAAGQYHVRVSVADPDGGVAWDTLTAVVDPPGTPQVFVGAGDVGTCAKTYDEATGRLLDSIGGTVFVLGDNAYPDGADSSYKKCFHPAWGRHKKRIHPVPGNHDYRQPGANGYFAYFGVAAGDPAKGYYSYDLGSWHIIALNSTLDMGAGSPEEQWLRADLAAHPARCTLAYWHLPRFSSGTTHGSQVQTQPLWQALYEYGADIVLAAHEHNYERFAPQTPDGTLDSARGIREFVVGTGGSGAYPLGPPIPNSELGSWNHGVLKLTLDDGAYTWQFIPVPGEAFTDTGSGTCH